VLLAGNQFLLSTSMVSKVSNLVDFIKTIFKSYFNYMLFEIIECNYLLQVYYELDEHRTKVEAKDVAICRVEQLCPFPYDLVQRELKRYPSMYL